MANGRILSAERCAPRRYGDFVVVGVFGGSIDFGLTQITSTDWADIFVAKLDSGGNPVWSKAPGTASGLWPYPDVATDGAGNSFVAGTFENTMDFGNALLASAGAEDVFIAKLAP